MSHSQRVPSEVNRLGRNVRPQPRSTEERLFLREAELETGVGLVFFAEKRMMQALQPFLAGQALNRPAFEVLVGIATMPGQTIRQMRARLDMTVPTFARIIGQLDRRGLIEKGKSAEDGRARTLTLSAEGKALIAPIMADLRDIMHAAYRRVGADQVVGAKAVLEAIITHEDSDDR